MGVATSCSSEDSPVEPVVDPSQPITFITNISDGNEGVSTRAYDNTWEADDTVGIFMLDEDYKLSAAHYKANNQYKIEAGDNNIWKLVSLNDANKLYYPVDGSKVRFIAYYPYDSTVTTADSGSDKVAGTYAVALGDQSKTKEFDLLYHKGTTSYNKTNLSAISTAMAFKHQLSKVIINVKKSSDMTNADISDLEIKINSIPTSATFDLATGTLSNWGAEDTANAKGNVTTNVLATPTTNYARTHEAIIVPHSYTTPATPYKGRTITFTFKDPDDNKTNVELKYDIPEGASDSGATYKAFSPEKKTVYNFTLSRNVITFEDVIVEDWIQDGDAIDENIY
jgi:hypothetical protein